MRALLPGGPIETDGAGETLAYFVKWFQDKEDFKVLEADSDNLTDRLQLRWRFSLRWPGETFQRVVEQRAYIKVVDGSVAVLDLLCSGFRPLEAAA
jgi:hypothetical protein